MWPSLLLTGLSVAQDLSWRWPAEMPRCPYNDPKRVSMYLPCEARMDRSPRSCTQSCASHRLTQTTWRGRRPMWTVSNQHAIYSFLGQLAKHYQPRVNVRATCHTADETRALCAPWGDYLMSPLCHRRRTAMPVHAGVSPYYLSPARNFQWMERDHQWTWRFVEIDDVMMNREHIQVKDTLEMLHGALTRLFLCLGGKNEWKFIAHKLIFCGHERVVRNVSFTFS